MNILLEDENSNNSTKNVEQKILTSEYKDEEKRR